MKKLIITKVDKNTYTLKDKENKLYNITFEFHDINILPKEGDTIYMSEKLLDENNQSYSDFYALGNLDSTYGRKITKEDDEDIIVINTNNKDIPLKRLYG